MKVILTPYSLEKYRPEFSNLKRNGWVNISFKGDSQEPKKILTDLNKQIALEVDSILKQKEFPVSITGDCIKTAGVLKSLRQNGFNPAILWLDAHGDFNTYEISPSGFIGGMALAILAGREEKSLLEDLSLEPVLENKVIIYDRRNLDKEEAVHLMNSKIRQPLNLKELLKECHNETELYLHFDTDIINPLDAPAMMYKAEGGPRLYELEQFFYLIKDKVVALSVTLWEPELDIDKKTENAFFKLLNIFN